MNESDMQEVFEGEMRGREEMDRQDYAQEMDRQEMQQILLSDLLYLQTVADTHLMGASSAPSHAAMNIAAALGLSNEYEDLIGG